MYINEDYSNIVDAVNDLYSEYDAQKEAIYTLEDAIESFDGGMDDLFRAGEEIARELGVTDPGWWRVNNNRILEILDEALKEVETKCNRLYSVLRS